MLVQAPRVDYVTAIAALCPPGDRGIVHTGECPVCGGRMQYGRTEQGELRAVCCTTAPCFAVIE